MLSMQPMTTTSESLLQRIGKATDDTTAWNRFVEIYTPLIFFWGRKAGLQSHDSADLVQEVLAIVLQKIATFQYDRNKSFRGWLRTVTLNKYRELRRKRKLDFVDSSQSVLAQLTDDKALESTWDLDYRRELVGRAIELSRKDFSESTWAALREFISSGRPAAAPNELVSLELKIRRLTAKGEPNGDPNELVSLGNATFG